ncbi:hypothetical protein NUU61_001907 [Penicillium alfredii]|uniref:Uncharacterized protein n=1 Tax=Penicillium alfredii TaxID=1506179 RepID=A0A9W9FQL2_9EURO|nr:uncharacterized protein NUU61_001907 [Penicillium alfredii]KAJ5104560.1 hypothetical protein NUU61_001907 [Penicillium alfredii]
MQKCHPAHDHRCHCPASAADLAAAESTTPKPILPESPRLLELNTDPPIRTPRRLEGQPRQLQRQPRELEAQNRWNAFARGGVRKIDRALNLLANASTADEEGVQQAMQQVDQRLIPRRLLKVEEEKVEEKKMLVIGDLIDLD